MTIFYALLTAAALTAQTVQSFMVDDVSADQDQTARCSDALFKNMARKIVAEGSAQNHNQAYGSQLKHNIAVMALPAGHQSNQRYRHDQARNNPMPFFIELKMRTEHGQKRQNQRQKSAVDQTGGRQSHPKHIQTAQLRAFNILRRRHNLHSIHTANVLSTQHNPYTQLLRSRIDNPQLRVK